MNSIPSEAVQAAAEALAGGPGDDFDRESAVAALTAALPHLKAHIIRELAQEAEAKMDEAEPWSIEMDDLEASASWLRRRAKETP